MSSHALLYILLALAWAVFAAIVAVVQARAQDELEQPRAGEAAESPEPARPPGNEGSLMGVPGISERMAALAALSGTQPGELPRHGLTLATLQVKLTDAALRSGATWAQVGDTLGLPAKLAKRNQKVLAARVTRDLLKLRNAAQTVTG